MPGWPGVWRGWWRWWGGLEREAGIGMCTHEEKKKQQILQHELDFHRQLVQISTDYALKALNSLFLINGMAATAILAAKNTNLYSSGFLFAAGAILSVAAIGVSYFGNRTYAAMWNPRSIKDKKKNMKTADTLMIIAMGIAVVAFVCFVVGLVVGAPELFNPTPQPSQQSVSPVAT